MPDLTISCTPALRGTVPYHFMGVASSRRFLKEMPCLILGGTAQEDHLGRKAMRMEMAD